MPTTTINGIQLYWELTGSSGSPLVLVHGGWDDHRFWDFVVPDLSQSFRVLTYDRRGHSQSERPTSQGSVREDVADLAGLIEELGLAPAHIAGNSFGGCIVLRLGGQRPDLFKSLIVHEPPLFELLGDQPEAQAELVEVNRRMQAAVALLEAGEMAAGTREFVETVIGVSWEKLPPEWQQRYIYNAPTWLDEMCDTEALTLDLSSLSQFPHPALVTQGATSPSYFPLVVTRIATVLPHVEHRTFSEAGHGPAVSHPVEYVKTVTEFITRAA
jgi:pimeloyl-ACP methyl ester carboxylesterase